MQVLKEEIKLNILQTAKELFLEKGFKAASMSMIARKAGISKSNLYNYFSSKESIYDYLTKSAYTAIEDVLNSLFDHDPDNINLEEYTALSSKVLCMLLTKYRNEILLITDCSSGTRHESYKEAVIDRIQEHFMMELTKLNILNDHKKDCFFIHYIAVSLVEGLLEIVRHNKSDSWIKNNIQLFVEYYISGHSHFIERYLK